MGDATVFRRSEQHRDRWSVFGASDGIRHLSERLTASDLKQYSIFEDFKDRFLETISADISVALWREGAVLFEEGSYIDVACFLVEGEAAAYLAKHQSGGTKPGPIFSTPRAVGAGAADTTGQSTRGETVGARGHAPASDSDATTFLSTMDFDLADHGDVVSLGPGECFGEIGALNGWPQSVTVKTTSECVLVQIRVPALRLMKRQSSGFRRQVDGTYRRRALLPQLRATPLFSGVTEEALHALAGRVELVSCDPGALVVEEGAPVDALHLVRSGFMRVTQRVGEGRAAVSYLSKGMTVGEVELLIPEVDRAQFSVSSVGYGELVRIAATGLREVLLAYPEVEAELWRRTVARIKETGASRADPRQSEFIQFALNKGLVEGNSILVIDLDTCTRCDDCVRACADTHGGQPRFVREGDRYNNLLIAKSCYHCEDPVCLIGCPTGAIRRADVGDVVEIQEPICIGCATCHDNCPYDAIVMQDTGSTWGDDALPKALRGEPRALASKCDLCYTSADGPACVRSCPQHSAFRVGSVEEFQALDRRGRS
jgi:Fe-S-cluster-containing dehydrogenase component/CRP-like cAMP-binding protein